MADGGDRGGRGGCRGLCRGDGSCRHGVLRRAGERDRGRELPTGQPAERLGHLGRRRRRPAGLRHRHQRRSRPVRPLQGQDRRVELPARHLPDGLLRRRWRAVGRPGRALGSASPEPARLPRRFAHRPRGLRGLGRLRVVVGAITAISGIYFAALVRRERRAVPATCRSSCATTRRLADALPDRRHDVAGLQPLRRQQPVRGRPRTPDGPTRSATTGRSSPARRGRGLGLQRRVSDGALDGAQWLRRQLLHRRRHRPPRRGAARARGRSCPSATTSTGRARSAATSRRRATPGSTSPSSAATRCSGRPAGRTTTARWSPTRRPTTTRRSTRPACGPARGAIAAASTPSPARPRTR